MRTSSEVNNEHGNADSIILSQVQSLSRWGCSVEVGSAVPPVDDEVRLKSQNPAPDPPRTAQSEIRKVGQEEKFGERVAVRR